VRVVLRESDRDWVNLHDDFRFLGDGTRFLWSSERSGHRHLEIVDAASGERRAITSGPWSVAKVVDVDEVRGTVTFTGSRDEPIEQHLYRVPLGGGRIEQVSREPGWHEAVFHRLGHDVYAGSYSDDRHPPQVRIFGREGKVLGTLPSAALVPEPVDLGPVPLFMELASPAGEPFAVRLVRAQDRSQGERYPLVVYVYSGPRSQLVRRAWPGERGLFDGWLANRGFAVARIDGRGTQRRGHDSERIYARRLGRHEIADQATAVGLLLRRFPELDPERVGIWGWSYGGYATLLALAHAPQIFRAGVSVAPVIDWRGYDTHYTERYLGLPAENAAGYDSSTVLAWADRIRGRLIVVHGTTDDNVHFRESMRLVRELVRLGKHFDLMVYPGTHMMESLEERRHLYELVWRSFAEGL
jgi:dipeptidyl-peptidase-4